jgi:hypothetical protein
VCRAKAALVCKSWEAAVRGSRSLWRHTFLDLDMFDEYDIPDLARWLRNRAQGIRELEVQFADPAW